MKKILLIMQHTKNRELLKDFFAHNYIVDEFNKSERTPGDSNFYDLVIVDNHCISSYKDDLYKMKEKSSPVLLPVLLIFSSGNAKEINEGYYLDDLIDEIIKIPVEKRELSIRIRSLLKHRELSREAKILTEKSPVGICVLQQGKMIFVNPYFCSILGRERDEMINKNFLDVILPEDRYLVQKQLEEITEVSDVSLEVGGIKSTGKCLMDLKFSLAPYRGDNAVLVIATDITERRKAEERVRYLSYHDSLTGLYNRAYLEEEMKRLDVERQLPLSIIMVDVNGLKLINDAYGHNYGDRLLTSAAEILKKSCRREDLIARWGGDEFVILLPQTPEKAVQEIAGRIKKESGLTCIESLPVQLAVGTGTKNYIDEDIFLVLKKSEDQMYNNKLVESRSARSSIVAVVLNTLKEKSNETEEHLSRMQVYSAKVANALALSTSEMDRLSLLATLHDIGKIVVPENIIRKPGSLTWEEWEEIKKHPEAGYRIARSSESFAHIAEEILAHHEKWDGRGYPRGFKGDDIPYLARIISIVDAYDVMTSGRPYKDPLSPVEALNELKRCAGTQFDPKVVEKFIEAVS